VAKAGKDSVAGNTNSTTGAGHAASAALPKVVGEVGEAAAAKENEVGPLREEMEQKLEQAGTKKKSSAGENA